MAARKKVSDAVRKDFGFVENRPLYTEDLSRDEGSRLTQKYNEHYSSIATRGQEKGVAGAEHFVDKKVTPGKSAHGLADRFDRSTDYRATGDKHIPGSGWYYSHNEDLDSHNLDRVPDQTMTNSSSVMSPLNQPSNERRAARGILDAQHENRPTTITPDIARTARQVIQKSGKKSTVPSEVLPDSQVGREVGFGELHPKAAAALSSNLVDERHPDMKTDVDWSEVRRGGVGVPQGIRGARGASLNELAPPGSAPKVNTYGTSGRNYDFKHTNVRAEHDFRLRNAHDQRNGGEMRGQMDFDSSGLNDDRVTLTQEHVDHVKTILPGADPATKGLRAGKQVQVRDLHPAAVAALASPDNPDPHLRDLSLLSSQHPTVQDSWQNASHADQPNIRAGKTNVYKAGGSEGVGYFSKKTLDSGEDVIDRKNTDVGLIGAPALQHAKQDKITRQTAGAVRDSMQSAPIPERTRNPEHSDAQHAGLVALDDKTRNYWRGKDPDHTPPPIPDIPSTGIQEVTWTQMRREAGKDDEYNKQVIVDKGNARRAATVTPTTQHHQESLFGEHPTLGTPAPLAAPKGSRAARSLNSYAPAEEDERSTEEKSLSPREHEGDLRKYTAIDANIRKSRQKKEASAGLEENRAYERSMGWH